MRAHFLVIGLVILIAAFVIALSAAFDRSVERQIVDQFNRQQLLLAETGASNIKAFFDRIKHEVFSMAELVSRLQISDKTIHELLGAGLFKDIRDIRMGITVVNNEGDILFTGGSWTIADPNDVDFAWKRLKMSCPGEAHVRQDSTNIYIVQPVCRRDSPAGAIVATLDIQDLAKKFLGPIKSGSRGYAWMMDGSGNLLYHPTQPTMMGRNLYRADASCLECHESFETEKRIIEGRVDDFGKYVAPSGEDKVLAFSAASVGNAKWIVSVSAPYSEITTAMQTSKRLHGWIIFLIFLTTSVGATQLILMNKRKIAAEEYGKRQTQLEQQAANLEQMIDARTKELTAEKGKLHTVVSAIGIGIILLDNHRKIVWTNEVMKQMVGREIVGESCEALFSDCDVVSTFETHDIHTVIFSNLFGQHDKYFQVTTVPMKHGEDVNGIIRLVQDVTEMKKMQDQMIDSEKLMIIGRLTEGIAAEIGNPLTSVFSFVRMLREMETDDVKKESLETIDSNMTKISEILKRLSGFSQMPVTELKNWTVESLLEYSLALVQYDPRVQDMTIVRDLGTHIPEILTDGHLFSQVVVNLVVNAADAMPHGGTLTIRSEVADGYIHLAFSDEGVGIHQADLQKIFEPFYTTKNRGSGLGLSVSRSIVQKLNGNLTVESEPHKGSVFTITLPVSNGA